MKSLSLIIPCYNEAKGLELLVERIANSKNEFHFSDNEFELILVDNGSTDNTQEIIKRLQTRYPFLKLVSVMPNVGYGNGIQSGLSASTKEIVAWTHADHQCDPADVFKAYRILGDDKKTLVKGFRSGRSSYERFISRCFEMIATIVHQIRFTEINAQPKVFHRNLLKLATHPPKDFAFDFYYLLAAFKNGYQIKQLPVIFPARLHGVSSWAHSFKSRFKTMWRMFKYILLSRIRGV